jgi:hypothetical protein
VKEWYSTAEVAAILGRAEFTVREWCRLGRVRAEKKKCGRGPASEWIVSHAEPLAPNAAPVLTGHSGIHSLVRHRVRNRSTKNFASASCVNSFDFSSIL